MPAMDYIQRSTRRDISTRKLCTATYRINIQKWIIKLETKQITIKKMKNLVNYSNKVKLNMRVRMNSQIISNQIMVWDFHAGHQ